MSANSNDALKCEFMKKSGYNGRIAGGTEYFCGDKFVQTTAASETGCGTNGLNCKQVTPENYPGAIPYGSSTHHSDFTTSEECDPSDTLNSRNALCNRKLGLNRNDYYDQGSIGCGTSGTNACKITSSASDKTASDYPCAFCGDGYVQTSQNENCGEGNDNNYYNSTAKGRCAAAFTVANNSTYTINISGVYCFKVKGGDGATGYSASTPGCYGATVEGCYELLKGDVVTFKVGSAGVRSKYSGDHPCSPFNGGGGGGGASWVYLTRSGTNTLLLVAGGGGGGGGGTSGTTDSYCGGGSKTNSATSYTDTTDFTDSCSDQTPGAGTVINGDNFTSSTGAGGRGGYYYKKDSCDSSKCGQKRACGGGGGGYAAGAAGPYYEVGGGGGGSYVNTTNYYDSGSSMTAGTTGVSSPSDGSITVQKPKSNATCSTSSCQWSTSYTTCN